MDPDAMKFRLTLALLAALHLAIVLAAWIAPYDYAEQHRDSLHRHACASAMPPAVSIRGRSSTASRRIRRAVNIAKTAGSCTR